MTLDESIKRYTDNAEYERTHGNLQGCLEFRQLAEWLSELKQLRERTKWIPVYEGMPEDGQNVLFCDIDEEIMLGYHVKGRSGTHFSQDGTWDDMKNVFAWMPLPEPYKEESEDTE